ncbi:MAG: hypothetical protein M0Q91_16775 [Methanoregula sp.]|jgi:hypothetical protein|nr:hypothetical protein [Methanoregula sp.]
MDELLYQHIRPEIRKLAMLMEMKFRFHEAERGDPFKPTTSMFLIQRYEEEWEELFLAMGRDFLADTGIDGKTPQEVWKEVADNCNLLCMIGVHYERTWKEHFKKVRGES